MKLPFAPRLVLIFLVLCFSVDHAYTQADPLSTPLPQSTLDILTNEISGQVIYNNMVAVSGAPWIRGEEEFTDTFYEAEKMFELVQSYGIDNARLERSKSDRLFDYPVAGELWITSPEKKLLGRLDADAALIARGSESADISGELIYLPPLNEEEAAEMIKPANRDKYMGKIALMWSHARGELAAILDSAGIRAVISFSSRERYFDPNMVVYSSGSYSGHKNLKLGMTVSWKQWSELLEDTQYIESVKVRCMAEIERKQDKFETVFSWIEGTEPDKPGVIFTAHLFEGYTKRGANDNTGGCVVQLEILRALNKLIREGDIERPRRNIYFLWPNEISGTYKFISENPEIISNTCININMDMVSEGLRLNNSWLTMGETPAQLASFYDGLAASILNYVWRTNDIVYLPDSPRGRRGGQYFPKPMMEKNGSIDAFRYYIHEATGGSDHLCFNNSSVGVPGIEFFTWPDYWYHADTDTPDKGDPTQMKRIAFIGAATAWAAANCTDDILGGMLDAVSDFAYKRFAERGLSIASEIIRNSDAEKLAENTARAEEIVRISADREIKAIESIEDIYSGSAYAGDRLNQSVKSWLDYKELVADHIVKLAENRADELDIALKPVKESKLDKKLSAIVPHISEDVKYKVFYAGSYPALSAYISNNTDSKLASFALSRDSRTLLSYINGKLNISELIKYAYIYGGRRIDPQLALEFCELLDKMGYLEFAD